MRREPRGRSSPPFARPSGGTAARCRASGRTISPRSRSRRAVERAGVPAGEIEDVYFGCANQAGEDNRNVARMAALLAGLPESVAGVTVNRLCASGLAAVVAACHAVGRGRRRPVRRRRRRVDEPRAARDGEARRRVPARQPDRLRHDARLALPEPADGGACSRSSRWARRARTSPSAGSVSREDQDAFALASQQRWAAASEAGRFDDELVAGRRRRPRRAPAAGHERRAARAAQAGVPRGRHRHRRQRERDQRRRGGARRRERGARARARRRAARRVRRVGRRRRRPARDGHRPGPGGAEAARARRGRRRRSRSRRAERGVRVAEPGGGPRARPRSPSG